MARTAKQNAPDGEAENVQEIPSKYKRFDKWLVNVKPIPVDDSAADAEYEATAIECKREGQLLEPHVVTDINRQAHNSGIMWFESGTITNGHKETLTVSRGKKR